MTQTRLITLTTLIGLIFSTTSCVPLAVGAAAGYVAHDQGYRVQPPVKKTEQAEPNDSYNPNY